ncbi:MAG: DinB family protein, partial [Cyclobacteriaceae bacterium]
GAATNSSIRQPQSKYGLLQSLVLIKDEVNELFFTFDFQKLPGKTEHPGLRFFNALEWLQFAEMHMRDHFRQKKRIDDKLFFGRDGAHSKGV